MKRTRILATILVAALMISTGCGTSDYIKSITISSTGASSGGFFNLVGQDGTVQLTVTANYHSGKTIDVTQDSQFAVSPVGTIFSSFDPAFNPGDALPPYGPTTVPISKSGLMTGVVSICTWIDLNDATTGKPQTPPAWAYTGFYQVSATYREFTSQPVAIGVGAAESNAPTGGCGPS